MKSALVFSLLLLISSPVFAAQNCNNTSNETESSQCLNNRVSSEKLKLEKLLADIRKKLTKYPNKLERFNKAQQKWEEYMTSQIDMLYYDRNGYALTLCESNEIVSMLQARIKQLKYWISSDTEGDVCGSGLGAWHY